MKKLYNAEDFLEQLNASAAMKTNAGVYLDQDRVIEAIVANREVFNGVMLDDFLGSRTLYGENRDHWHFKVGFAKQGIQRIVVDRNMVSGRRIRALISYDGTLFYGFQAQKDERTVQAEIDSILTEINGFPTRLRGASRTDAGVHATGQVIDFETARVFTPAKWMHILNRRLPKDIHVKSVHVAPPLFHSRFDVEKKQYRYTLNQGEYDPLRRNFEWTVENLDLEVLKHNLGMLLGRHDFTSFCHGEKDDRTRTIFKADYENTGNRLELVFVGDGFLHYMLRLIVYQLVQIASGKVEHDIAGLLSDMSRKRTTRMAPAGGLCLEKVFY